MVEIFTKAADNTMRITSSHTDHAPAVRAEAETIRKQSAYFNVNPPDTKNNKVPIILMILNKERQVIYSNEQLTAYLKIENDEEVISYRPGEILGCIHACETPGGCGTTKACGTCGAMQAIASAQAGLPDIQECRILKKESGDALDFRIWTTPISVNNEIYVTFSMVDISDEKRRRVLERIYFHDVLNTAGGLKGLIDLICDPEYHKADELMKLLPKLAERLIDEINAQKELTAAENNELLINPTLLNSAEIIKDAAEIYTNHQIVQDKIIVLDKDAVAVGFISDKALVMRVIGNMVKNALEAIKPGGTVRLSCCQREEKAEFSVHNSSFIPEHVQLQIFQRSFSTKGKDRGLGTYSMKLLSERYLKGKVSFNTDESAGTTFYVQYPMNYYTQ